MLIYNSKVQNLSDFIIGIEKNLGLKAIKNFLPMQKGDVKETYADNNLLFALTGFKPKIDIKEGIKNSVIGTKVTINYYVYFWGIKF